MRKCWDEDMTKPLTWYKVWAYLPHVCKCGAGKSCLVWWEEIEQCYTEKETLFGNCTRSYTYRTPVLPSTIDIGGIQIPMVQLEDDQEYVYTSPKTKLPEAQFKVVLGGQIDDEGMEVMYMVTYAQAHDLMTARQVITWCYPNNAIPTKRVYFKIMSDGTIWSTLEGEWKLSAMDMWKSNSMTWFSPVPKMEPPS